MYNEVGHSKRKTHNFLTQIMKVKIFYPFLDSISEQIKLTLKK